MNDYEPLDISTLCNAGLDVLGEGEEPPTGSVKINGLPFQVGPEDGGGHCFVALDGSPIALTLDINATAYSVIVAHRLLESGREDGILP